MTKLRTSTAEFKEAGIRVIQDKGQRANGTLWDAFWMLHLLTCW